MASISTCLTLSPKSRLLTAKPSFSLNFFPGVQTLTSSSTFSRKSGNLFRPRVSFPVIKASTGVGSNAIRPGGAVETDKLPSDVRKRVMEAVDAFGGRVTIGDVASKAGLNLNLSQKALQALASDTNGFLEAGFIFKNQAWIPPMVDQQQKNHPFSALGRQSSIYSLTLDEFKHTLCEGGTNFGSMNMDEFLTSIWNAEENQAINSNDDNHHQNYNCTNKQVSSHAHLALNETSSSSKGIAKLPSLPRQGLLTIPAPLCRKTVDEVWSEIHREQQGQGQSNNNNIGTVQNADNSTWQPTFGEMTLEDFLIKAGVVREQCMPPAAPPPQHHPKFGLYQTSKNPAVGPGFVSSPIMGMGSNDAFGGSAYQTMPPGGVIGDSSGYVNDGKKGGGYQPAASPPTAVCYNGKVAAAPGAYGPGQALGVVSPMTPISSEGMWANQVDNGATQFGMDMGGLRGRKRIIDGPIER